jgi:hypothetical protein
VERIIILALLLQVPGLASAGSPLRLECAAEQSAPGRALVCEYSMLDRRNASLADLHDGIVQAGRAGRVEVKRWLAARDACGDVDCLDQVFDAAIRDARLALVDVESRQPATILVNARGIPLRVSEPEPKAIPAPTPSVQEAPARERSGLDTAASLLMVLFLVAALSYAVVAKRLAV